MSIICIHCGTVILESDKQAIRYDRCWRCRNITPSGEELTKMSNLRITANKELNLKVIEMAMARSNLWLIVDETGLTYTVVKSIIGCYRHKYPGVLKRYYPK